MNDLAPPVLSPMMSGEPVAAMEVAKQIIGGKIVADHALLADVASNAELPKWTRIAAIYALGFLGDKEVASSIRKILRNENTDPDIRGHAAEALGNIGDRGAIRLLRSVLRGDPSDPLRASCNYALTEMSAQDG